MNACKGVRAWPANCAPLIPPSIARRTDCVRTSRRKHYADIDLGVLGKSKKAQGLSASWRGPQESPAAVLPTGAASGPLDSKEQVMAVTAG